MGEQVRLWPYARGVYARDVLYRLWLMVEESKDMGNLFWGSQDPEAIRGDLPSFCKFFDDPNRVLIVVATPDGSDLIGFLFFDDFVTDYRCFGSVYIKPDYRGTETREAITMSCDLIFNKFHLEAIWGATLSKAAVLACRMVGFEQMATLPEFTRVDGQVRDAYIVRKLRS